MRTKGINEALSFWEREGGKGIMVELDFTQKEGICRRAKVVGLNPLPVVRRQWP